ncbi:proton-translocating transhydrogenase family protein [Hyphococcus luteus]|uniref:proton-translocating NAD(P)(+) transhydrogenase n=1 Tax=Hyphococcus luteus TaxID=2058213 RepID=A0A2S7K4V6_9PROT|nr:proton-translocating transhydrogenase family protein [Marinicaulis flavus]PQA87506.1 NAD synthetase [Marinicaulis flavus]
MQDKKEQVEEAAKAAEEAAKAAEAAAANATGNADAAQAAADQARDIADQLAIIAASSPISDFVFLATIFILAIFVGYYVVWSVTPALHTPLMSVTNAISSVVIVGALIALGADLSDSVMSFWPKFFGFVAVALASVNIFGGFLVTQRMLAMYKKKER